MISSIAGILIALIFILNQANVFAKTEKAGLENCLIETNCVLVQWEFKDPNIKFKQLVKIAKEMPRTTVINSNDKYWHGLVRSFIFRFPDDIEVLQLKKEHIIQVRSASRIGIGDLGVNQKRIDLLYSKLKNF